MLSATYGAMRYAMTPPLTTGRAAINRTSQAGPPVESSQDQATSGMARLAPLIRAHTTRDIEPDAYSRIATNVPDRTTAVPSTAATTVSSVELHAIATLGQSPAEL